MTPDELVQLERIKQLKYRYVRFLDQKDWDGVEDCFLPEATANYGGGDTVLEGRDAIMDFLKTSLAATTRITTHAVGQPEIELLSPDEAGGTWALHDEVIDLDMNFMVRGASFYSDRYARVSGAWLIRHTGYKRIYEELLPRPENVRVTASWWGTGGKSELLP